MIWLQEIAWWKKDLSARTRTTTTSSESADWRERWCICSTTTAAAVCIAGVVVVSAAWASLRKRWVSTSRTHGERVEHEIKNMDALVAHLRGRGSGPTAARNPPLLLLCAAPAPKTAPLTARVPPSMPLLALDTTTDGFLPSIPLFRTAMDDISCDVFVLSVTPPTPVEIPPTPPILLLCAEAKEQSVALVPVADSAVAPLAALPLPVLFLCSVLAEMASLYLPRVPAPMPVLSLSSLATVDGLLSLDFPLVVVGASDGVADDELLALMAQGTGVSPLLLLGDGRDGTGGVSAVGLVSVSSRAAESACSPAASTSSGAGKDLWGLPSKHAQQPASSTTDEHSLHTPPTLWGANIKNPSRATTKVLTSNPPSASPLSKPLAQPTTVKQNTPSRGNTNDDSGGGHSLDNLTSDGTSDRVPARNVNNSAGGAAAPATKTSTPPAPSLWSLPGQARSAAPRGRSSVRSSAWALGRSRRGSISPEFFSPRRTTTPRSSEKGASGRSGRSPSRGRRAAAAAVDGGKTKAAAAAGVTTAKDLGGPRSILVTCGKKSVNPRRAAAVARGVRWLDVVQKEEEQARIRRERASRWIGNGGRKRDGPPKATPRASRARAFAEEGERVANGASSS